MKRLRFSVLIALMLVFALILSVGAKSGYVFDYAGLFTQQEAADLERTAGQITQAYGMDVIILTVDDTQGLPSQQYADDFYDQNGFGTGEEKSGILFLLNMGAREWHISTCGNAISVFTDYGLDQLGELVLSDLSGGYYYSAFDTFLNALPAYFESAAQGVPVDVDSGDNSVSHFLSLLIGLVAALISILVMRGSMNTKKPQRSAVDYTSCSSFHLRTRQDMFLYSQISKTKKQQQSTSSGGSTVHRSASGRSHGGRGGKF